MKGRLCIEDPNSNHPENTALPWVRDATKPLRMALLERRENCFGTPVDLRETSTPDAA
jgi:hypothetical protein